MLIDKHRADNIFRRVPGLTIKMNPELTAMDKVLDDDELFRLVHDDLARRYPKTLTAGRKSTPVEVILRMLAIKHLYDFSYEETEQHVADSLVLRQFCRVYFHSVPDHTTLCRWARLIQPTTLSAFNERVLALAVANKLTRGRKLRMDAMVVETDIHYPTDSSLLADGVRLLGRTLTRAKAVVGQVAELTKERFRNRTRSARRAAREIARLSRQGKEKTRPAYSSFRLCRHSCPDFGRSLTRQYGVSLQARRFPPLRSWSVSSSPIATSFVAAKPISPLSLDIRFG
jgi:IS5 family transposase